MERKKLHPLKQNHLFARAYHKGKCYATSTLVLYVLPGRDRTRTLLGITVSKKRGKAVVRNRIKRRLREAYRSYLPQLVDGKVLVLVARQPAVTEDYARLREDLGRLLGRASMLRPQDVPTA